MSQSAIPFQQIAGQALNEEQRSYLEGLFAGLYNRGVRFGDAVPEASSTSLEDDDLIFEERVKRDLHPLDAFDSLVEDSLANRAPAKENVFRYKWRGLFYLAPSSDAFMCRLRIPGGQVKAFQLRELASISKALTTGYIQITTRANFQLRNIEARNTVPLLRRIESVGLTSQGSGADNIRNITCSPTAGIDPEELVDTLPLAREIGDYIIHHREFYDLPRKFNIALDGGGTISSVADTNDIGWSAVELGDAVEGLEAGVYFRLALGGATGHKAFARDAGIVVPAAQLVKVTAALLRVFIANGNRENRKKARLKHLLDKWTVEQYLEETEKLLGYSLIKLPPGDESTEQGELMKSTAKAHPQVGVFPQRQPGMNYIGVAVPVGQLTGKQLIKLADLAEQYGNGEVRLTVWQNLLIPSIADENIEAVKKALVKMGLDWRSSNLKTGFVACTGNSYCKFASSNTKKHAVELMKFLDKRHELDQPINVHLTGCPHSCAQHYMGDVGLLAAKVNLQGESVEGYHIFVGGGFGRHQKVGRQVFQGLTFEQVRKTMDTMFTTFREQRKPEETFQDFTNRHDLNALQVMFSGD